MTKRALELHDRYAKVETARSGRAWTRDQLAQGFVGDVGDLTKLVMAKAGARPIENVDAKLAHELADCLWSVLVLAKLYDVDLEKAFLTTMDELEAKLKPAV